MEPIYFNKELHQNPDYPENQKLNLYMKVLSIFSKKSIKLQNSEVSELF